MELGCPVLGRDSGWSGSDGHPVRGNFEWDLDYQWDPGRQRQNQISGRKYLLLFSTLLSLTLLARRAIGKGQKVHCLRAV